MTEKRFGRFLFRVDAEKEVAEIQGKSWNARYRREELAGWHRFYRELIKKSRGKDKSGFEEMKAGIMWAIGEMDDE